MLNFLQGRKKHFWLSQLGRWSYCLLIRGRQGMKRFLLKIKSSIFVLVQFEIPSMCLSGTVHQNWQLCLAFCNFTLQTDVILSHPSFQIVNSLVQRPPVPLYSFTQSNSLYIIVQVQPFIAKNYSHKILIHFSFSHNII